MADRFGISAFLDMTQGVKDSIHLKGKTSLKIKKWHNITVCTNYTDKKGIIIS